MFALIPANSGHKFVGRGDPDDWDFDKTDFTADSSWHELDLSAIVPVTAVAVLFSVYIYVDAAGKYIQFRPKGNSNIYNTSQLWTQVINKKVDGQFCVALDGTAIIEYKLAYDVYSELRLRINSWFE